MRRVALVSVLALVLTRCAPSTSNTGSVSPPPVGSGEGGQEILPTYNALLTPRSVKGANHISRRAPTHVSFHIGPRDPESALPLDQWTVHPEVLEQAARRPLTVTMNCAFCANSAVQKQPITYDRVARLSSKAEFEIEPSPQITFARGEIIFLIGTDGVELDRVTLPVVFDEQATTTTAEATAVNVLAPMQMTAATHAESARPDVVLTVGLNQLGLITTTVQISNKDVISSGAAPDHASLKNLQQDGSFRSFTSAAFTPNQLATLELDQYLKIGAVVDQNDKLARDLLQASELQRLPSAITTGLKLSGADGATMLDRFCEAGTFLYAKLFADPELQEIINAVEHADLHRPLRVEVDSAQIYAPWQYLHPPGDCEAKDFWGFKFELMANPMVGLPAGSPRAASPTPQLSSVLFLGYKGDGNNDSVNHYAQMEADAITQQLRPRAAKLVTAQESGAFGAALAQGRTTLDLLVVFAHASSGVVVGEIGGQMMLADDPIGPRIILSKSDVVKATDVYKLRTSLPLSVRTVLAKRPLVFLNACETGAIGAAPVASLGFPGTFLELGARAVISTEAPVWVLFGHKFGSDLTASIIGGEPPALALLKLRQKYLAENNPLGLLYTYFGDGASRFQ